MQRSATHDEAQLVKGLRRRHVNLIALGGVIGAGMFLGKDVVIGDAGPAAVVSFLIGGILTMLIMRMLAEMATAQPVVGSFYVYAGQALGRRVGFVTGWAYWYLFEVIVAVQAVAAGRILHLWLPSLPSWLLGLGLLLVLTASNLVSVRWFGECEYWLSSIKVVAIVVFIGMGGLWIIGLWPHSTPGLANLVDHGGFAPFGWGAVLAAVVPCLFFYAGAEVVTIAAAESDKPDRVSSRALKFVVLCSVVFYVGAILIELAMVPWNSKSVDVSAYASALKILGIPAVATVTNFIVLAAVLSYLNCALYVGSRMLFALTTRGDGPPFFAKLSPHGVPSRALLLGTAVGVLSVIGSHVAIYVWGDLVFNFLINSYGGIILIIYLIIAISQVVLRRRLERAGPGPGALPVKMWLFPWLSYAMIGLLATVILAMALLPRTRSHFLVSGIILLMVFSFGEIVRRRSQGAGDEAEGTGLRSVRQTPRP